MGGGSSRPASCARLSISLYRMTSTIETHGPQEFDALFSTRRSASFGSSGAMYFKKNARGFFFMAASIASASSWALSSRLETSSRICRARVRPPTMPDGRPRGLPDWPGLKSHGLGVCFEQSGSDIFFMRSFYTPPPGTVEKSPSDARWRASGWPSMSGAGLGVRRVWGARSGSALDLVRKRQAGSGSARICSRIHGGSVPGSAGSPGADLSVRGVGESPTARGRGRRGRPGCRGAHRGRA